MAPARLRLNPCATLSVVRRHERVVAVTVRAPVRGESLRTTTVLREREPGLVKHLACLANAIQAGEGVELDLTVAQWGRLAAAGFLLPAEKLPRPVRFHCSLPRPKNGLVPRRLRVAAPVPTRHRRLVVPWTVRTVSDASSFEPPLDAARTWVSVEVPSVAVPAWYALGRRQAAIVAELQPGEPPPPGLEPALRARLIEAGLIQDRSAARRAERRWARECEAAAAKASTHRYVVLRRLVHPWFAAAVRRYYRQLVAQGAVQLGDVQNERRFMAHNEPLAGLVHRALVPLVARIAREAVKRWLDALSGVDRIGIDLADELNRTLVGALLDGLPEPAVLDRPREVFDPEDVEAQAADLADHAARIRHSVLEPLFRVTSR